VSGGWCFNIPSETATQSSTEPATEAVNGAHVETADHPANLVEQPATQEDEPFVWAAANELVVNGTLPVKEWPHEAGDLEPGKTYIATVEPNGVVSDVKPFDEPPSAVVTATKPVKLAELAKHKRQRTSKVAERRQPAKSPSADKPAATGKTKNAAPKAGKGAELLGELKRGWLSVPQMLEFTGWQKHTLRGYVSRTAKAEGWTLEHERRDGVTHYRIKV
jgi:Protein of unknown function (DUF3489)